jgi:GYF domain 2
MTEGGWFYAEADKPVGPVTSDALVSLLRNMSEPGKVKVWRTGFPDWQDAKDVPQIFDQISRPPPLSGKRLERTPELVREAQPTEKKNETKSGQKNTLGRVVLVIALAIVLCVGGIFSTVIYNNSAVGIARLVGEFTGAALGLLALAWLTAFAKRVPRANGESRWSRWRRWHPSDYITAFILVIAVLVVGLNNRQLLLDGLAAEKGETALKDISTPEQLERALAKNPSNFLLQITAHTLKEAQETDRLAQKLSDEIEPPSLAKDIDYAKTTRAELEAYLRDLKTAEANATVAIPRYLALLKDERRRVETFMQSLQIDKGVMRDALNGIDKRHARTADLGSMMLTARADLYRTLGNAVAILVEQFGNYKVDANGRFIFSNQRNADRYNAASSEVDTAAKRLSEVQEELKRFAQFQQEQWERFISSK